MEQSLVFLTRLFRLSIFTYMKRRYIIEPVNEQEKILMDMQLPKEQRILKLLRLIRYSNVVADAGAKYRSSR